MKKNNRKLLTLTLACALVFTNFTDMPAASLFIKKRKICRLLPTPICLRKRQRYTLFPVCREHRSTRFGMHYFYMDNWACVMLFYVGRYGDFDWYYDDEYGIASDVNNGQALLSIKVETGATYNGAIIPTGIPL